MRAGFNTVRSLAEQLGVALSQVVEWGRGRQRPMWRHVAKLADALGVSVEEVVTGIWGESLGDPCSCGCGGKKIFPTDPTSRKLLIEVPCAACKKKRTHIQGNQRFHFKLCPACAGRARRGKRVRFECVGYNDHHTRRWAKQCPRRIEVLPYQIRQRQKQYETLRYRDQQEELRFKRRQHAFIDEPKKKLRCGRCASAAMVVALTEKRVEAVTKRPIKSRSWRTGMLSKHVREINPNFVKCSTHAPKNPQRSEAARRSLTISNIIKGWSKEELPQSVRLGICLVCGKITFSTKRPSKFHRVCWREWVKTPEGLIYQGTKSHKPPLQRMGPGRPRSEDNLRVHLFRAIQHYLAKQSFDEIAAGTTREAVKLSVDSLIADLPRLDVLPNKFRWRRLVELLLEQSGTISASVSSSGAAVNG